MKHVRLFEDFKESILSEKFILQDLENEFNIKFDLDETLEIKKVGDFKESTRIFTGENVNHFAQLTNDSIPLRSLHEVPILGASGA